MKIFKTKPLYLAWKNNLGTTKTIGFVPTMGALHSGHLSLIEQSKGECDFTVCSIFVNPTQFNNAEDFEKYPVTTKLDLQLLEKIGCDAVFLPTVEEMYPNNEKVEHFDFSPFDVSMEGSYRPGHFDGVGTIVGKLFEAIEPDISFFGQKDFQQLKVIEKLVEIKNYHTKIVGCPIVREDDGLAMSSRNKRLSDEHRKKAVFIYQVLKNAKQQAISHNVSEIKNWVIDAFSKEEEFELDYFEIASELDLQPTSSLKSETKPRAFIAAFLGGVRLIDNLALNG